jgi:hypothetical protein
LTLKKDDVGDNKINDLENSGLLIKGTKNMKSRSSPTVFAGAFRFIQITIQDLSNFKN